MGSCENKDFVFEENDIILAPLSHCHVPSFAHTITNHDEDLPLVW